jgi:hypothetical protein
MVSLPCYGAPFGFGSLFTDLNLAKRLHKRQQGCRSLDERTEALQKLRGAEAWTRGRMGGWESLGDYRRKGVCDGEEWGVREKEELTGRKVKRRTDEA